MDAIRFNVTIPRYLLGLALGKFSPKFFWSGLTCTGYKQVPEPVILGNDWVKVKTLMGGICGSDASQIKLILTPYYEPLNSRKHTMGHENVGRIAAIGENVENIYVGDRVVVEPLLWCVPRGFKDLCRFCERGEINRCERFSEGDIAPGLQIGACEDTGGSWSPYFLAHKSQIYKIPDNISNQSALLIEPFSSSLHAVLQNFPQDTDKVLIVGAGTVGLGVLAALRGLDSRADIMVIGRHDFQVSAAKRLGASHVVVSNQEDDYFSDVAAWSKGTVKQPILGRQIMIGGADKVFECVGKSSSIDDATRLTRNGGRVVLVGAPGVINLDWTSIDAQELEIKSSLYYHHAEKFLGQNWKTFDLAIELMANGKVDLGWLVTHKFPLHEYKKAFELTNGRGKNKALKIAFEFPE